MPSKALGLYAPCMILVSLLGMSPGSVSYHDGVLCLPNANQYRFFQNQRYQISSALGLRLAGVPAVLLAAFFVKSFEPNIAGGVS